MHSKYLQNKNQTKNKMKKILISILLIVIILCINKSCTDQIGARKTLNQNNYRVLNVGGGRFIGGHNSTTHRTEFKAIAPNGDTVTGIVARSLGGGNEILLDE